MQSRMSGSSSLARRRSSSLSDLDDIDTEQETKASIHNSSAAITDDNDSEAETERLHDSPHLLQRHKKVILGPDNHGQVFDRSPSKLQNQISVENQHNALSGDDESSLSEVESPSRESDVESPRAASPQLPPVVKDEVSPNSRHVIEYVKDSLAAEQNLLPPSLADTKKRKRSIMADSSLVELVEEPSRKRTGSVKTSADDFAIEDDPLDEEADKANDVIDVLTDEDAAEAAAALREDITMADAEDEGAASQPQSPRRASRRKRRPGDSEVNGNHAEDTENGIPNGDAEGEEGDDDPEVVAKSEEELEKKRLAFEQLISIEPLFATFRDRLYNERLEALGQEEAMLRQAEPNHPDYIAMMRCIDDRRDERIRIANRLLDLKIQTLKVSARAGRSQILTQYQQDVREIRERYLEMLGKEWYDIQHDRRAFSGTPQDYGLRFPTRKSEQIRQHIAYSHEVSILSGVAKYVGFPAAPHMTPASNDEFEEDMIKMGRARPSHHNHVIQPYQDLAALRVTRLQPAEEQFLERTPWANAQHPSHANIIQRQASHHVQRIKSPFAQNGHQPRRHSHQHGFGVPLSGTFSTTSGPPNGGRASPHSALAVGSQNQAAVPSPLATRSSLSPRHVSQMSADISDPPQPLSKPVLVDKMDNQGS